MRIRNLVAACKQRDDLCVVSRQVPREAIPGLIQEEEQGRNRAVLFESVEGYNVPVTANLYGTLERYGLGLGTDAAGIWSKIDAAIARPAKVVQTSKAPCFEVIHDDPDITKILPLVQYSVLDAAPYITSGVVFMKNPDTGRRNISFIRLMVKGPQKLGFNPKSLHNKGYYSDIALAGKRMEVAITLGPPSEMLAAGAAYIPDGVDELEVATALAEPEQRNELAVVKCATVDIEIPAGSEVVIEGVVSTDLEPEGPFGDWTGCYARPQNKPTLRIQRASHRRDPIYQTILPGTSKEQILLTIVRFYPELEEIRKRYPGIRDYTVPDYSLGRLVIAAVSRGAPVDKIMGDFLKIQCINRVMVVNDDVDIHNPADVLWAFSNRVLEKEKVLAYGCEDEWWNNVKLGIDTTVDIRDIRHTRPRIIKMPA
ncbi:MAG: UbiD family decarboxylase [Deltaproteobacteria bacterium]|nr:UbiD family decarboxylase [Deltaproteobacteria bacterium]